jgi:hypothetical protein
MTNEFNQNLMKSLDSHEFNKIEWNLSTCLLNSIKILFTMTSEFNQNLMKSLGTHEFNKI